MAKKDDKPKIVLERVYNVPLRREFQKVARWRKTEKAVKALKQFVAKHMKSDNVLIGRYVNQHLWKNGIKNPPHHVKINAVKDEKGKVSVELVELPAKAKRQEAKQTELKKKKEDKEAKKEAKKEEPKAGTVKDEKLEEKTEEKKGKEEKSKEIQKEEIKELKKELPQQHIQKPPVAPKNVEQRPTAPKGQ